MPHKGQTALEYLLIVVVAVIIVVAVMVFMQSTSKTIKTAANASFGGVIEQYVGGPGVMAIILNVRTRGNMLMVDPGVLILAGNAVWTNPCFEVTAVSDCADGSGMKCVTVNGSVERYNGSDFIVYNSTEACVAEHMACVGGDFSRDGKLSQDDLGELAAVLDAIQATGVPYPDKKCADVNGDKFVTGEDGICLASLVSGAVKKAPECAKCKRSSAREICHDGVDNDCDGQTDVETSNGEDLCSCTINTPCNMLYDADGLPGLSASDRRWCANLGDGWGWYDCGECAGTTWCSDMGYTARTDHPAGTLTWRCNKHHLCADSQVWAACSQSNVGATVQAAGGEYSCTAAGWAASTAAGAITISGGSLYLDGDKFLIKGITYAPWLAGTGPDPYLHEPFPGEYDDVTSKVTSGGVTRVRDYSGDGKIQTWEVIRHDLETMKGAGANTIRTYAAGSWHDKNMDGVTGWSAVPEENEIVQGDLPDWAITQMLDFAQQNGMKVFIGYWVQEEDFEDEDPSTPGHQLKCDWQDLEVAKKTLGRLAEKFGGHPALLGWSVGNEVHGEWNQGWFTWTVDINEYLNRLYAHLKGISGKPILYAKYVGEDVDFSNLDADIIGPQAYTHPAGDILSSFQPAPPEGRAYMIAEYGHIIEQAPGHWALSKQHAGGCFLEYSDVWWKGQLSNDDVLGMVTGYREIKHERYDVLVGLYSAQ